MNKSIFVILLSATCGLLSAGCTQTRSFASADTTQSPQNRSEGDEKANLKWLDYADAKADANLAIQKNNFELLAFAGRVTSFPGIKNQKIDQLKIGCGYKLLPNSSDALNTKSELSARKNLYQYATTYNELVSEACSKQLNN